MDEKFDNSRSTRNRDKGIAWGRFPGQTRRLAAGIVIPPFSARRKALKTSKRQKIDGDCQDTTRKSWSLCRLVTSLPVSNSP
jgi:hypothetical protein